MSYTFKPMSEDEIFNVLPKDTYPFKVLKSTRKVSKNGNDMAELHLEITDKQGIYHYLYDYLVFSTVPMNIRKVKHFCDAVGLGNSYTKGELPENLENLSGLAVLGIQEEQMSPSGIYPRKNKVDDYMISTAPQAAKQVDYTCGDELYKKYTPCFN